MSLERKIMIFSNFIISQAFQLCTILRKATRKFLIFYNFSEMTIFFSNGKLQFLYGGEQNKDGIIKWMQK